MSAKTGKKKVAILAIGRFSPPHGGHIQLVKHCWMRASAMKEQGIDACAYCWVSPSDKEMNRPKKPGEDSKNPLSTADKLHYLCKMIRMHLCSTLQQYQIFLHRQKYQIYNMFLII